MKRITAVLILAGAAVLWGSAGCSALRKSDLATLQGTWKGQLVNRPTGGLWRLVISGNAAEFRDQNSNEGYQGTLTLREDTNPRQAAFVITRCAAQQYVGKTARGIYHLERGTLTFTSNEPGNPEVPSGFDAPGSRKYVLRRP